MDFLQADNEMRTFAKETGGQAFFPRFQGEIPASLPGDPPGAAESVRHSRTSPAIQAHDGSFRKIKVELVNPATNEPLPVKDEKGKPVKYTSSPRPATKRRAPWNKTGLGVRCFSTRRLRRTPFVKHSISRFSKMMQIR